jgi:FemAB-related protein (PEP-CTERM system-associated)
MLVTVANRPSQQWDPYVAAHPEASLYHRSGWTLLAGEVFGQQLYFLEAKDAGGCLVGVLPIVKQRGALFGTFMTSIPYFNYGGALGDSEPVVIALMERARQLARECRTKYLELRDRKPHGNDWMIRTDKVSMVLDLPADVAALGTQLGAKLRSQTRRADREGVQVSAGGADHVDAFYDVFSRNMHALGTPVYPKRFFTTLVDRFPGLCRLIVIRSAGIPMAAGFLLIDGKTAEIPWAACRDDAKPLGFNMKLYWESLAYAIGQGCAAFDFGRSTANSGTSRFKAQWGAKPRQLYWHRWEKYGGATTAEDAGIGTLRQLVTRAWTALPLSVANFVGPLVSPRLPW